MKKERGVDTSGADLIRKALGQRSPSQIVALLCVDPEVGIVYRELLKVELKMLAGAEKMAKKFQKTHAYKCAVEEWEGKKR